VERSKGEHRLIKNDITRDVDTTLGDVKTLEAFVKITITKKGTLFGPKLEFTRIVRSQIRPTSTPEGAKGKIIWFVMKKAFKRSLTMNDFARKTID
jgi:hypothetical protein